MGLSIYSSATVSGKHRLFWVVSSGGIGCLLDCVKGFAWELRKVRLIPVYKSPSLRLHLGSCRVLRVEG